MNKEKDNVFVKVDLSIRSVTPGEVIYTFQKRDNKKVSITRNELMQSMVIMAQLGEQDRFNEVMDVIIDYSQWHAKTYGSEEEAGPRPGLWFHNLAVGAAMVDQKMGFRNPIDGEITYLDMYKDENNYGPTMTAYANYLDLKGLELITFVEESSSLES